MNRLRIAGSNSKNLKGSNIKNWSLVEFKGTSLGETLYIFSDLASVIEEAAGYAFEELLGKSARRISEAKGLDPWGDEADELETKMRDQIFNLVKRGEFAKLQQELSILPETVEMQISILPITGKSLDSKVLQELQKEVDYLSDPEFRGIEDYLGFSVDSMGETGLLTGI